MYLYRSPFLSGLHCRGLTFGLQFMHDREDHQDRESLPAGASEGWRETGRVTKETGAAGLLAGVAPFFLEAWDAAVEAGAKTLLECGGHPLIVEATRGKRRMLVVSSNMFANRFLCLPKELRKEPFKPGNQALAKNLMKHLLGALGPRIEAMEFGASKAHLHVRGRGGEIRFQVPWKDVIVRLDGKDMKADRENSAVVIQVPPGGSRIELLSQD